MDTYLLKDLLVSVILAFSLIFSLLPIKIYQCINDRMRERLINNGSADTRLSEYISCLSCFAGGVFLSVIFLHLLPDAHKALETVNSKDYWITEYPLVEIVSLIGFFLIYMSEAITESCFSQRNVAHDQGLVTRNPGILKPRGSIQEDKCSIHERGHGFQSDFDASVTVVDGGVHTEEALIVRTVSFVLALVFHSIVEGFAFGVQTNPKTILPLFIGIIVHRSVVAFSVGTRLINCHPTRVALVVLLAVIFAISSPLFAVIGITVQQSEIDLILKEQITFVLISLSIGTFIYIAFFEMLAPEKTTGKSSLLKFGATLVGFAVIFVVMIFRG